MLAIRGPHIVTYLGPALDNILASLGNESLQANALGWLRIDYARLLPLLSQLSSRAANHSSIPAESLETAKQQLDQLGELGLAIEVGIELDPAGIVFQTEITLDKAP